MISCERKRGGDFNVDFSEDSSGEGYKLYHSKYLLQGSSARYIYIYQYFYWKLEPVHSVQCTLLLHCIVYIVNFYMHHFSCCTLLYYYMYRYYVYYFSIVHTMYNGRTGF